MIYYLIVVFVVFASACSQMLLKKGASVEYNSFIRQYLNPWVISGYGIMGLAVIVNIYCMSKGVQVKELSIIESLSYLFVPCLSWMFFGEKLTKRKALAIGLILIGIIIFFS